MDMFVKRLYLIFCNLWDVCVIVCVCVYIILEHHVYDGYSHS